MTTNLAARKISSGNAVYKRHAKVHTQKRGAARINRIIFLKMSQYFAFWPG
jgi:hypothetical protein